MRKSGAIRRRVGHLLRSLGVAAGAGVLALSVHAAGTPAGTLIDNTATLRYSLPGLPNQTAEAVSPPVVVAKVINVVVTWQDAAPVPSRSPDTDRPLAFLVTNTGNAPETFRLSRNDAVAGDQFDPAAAAIYLESGAQPGFQASGPAADIAYVAGSNDPLLAADRSVAAYLVSAVPAGVATGSQGRSALVATSTTPGSAGAAPGSSLGVIGGVLVVAGSTQASAAGSYLVSGVSLGLAKSVAGVRDPAGGTRVMSGAVLTYRIVLTLTGAGVAENVAMQDPLPSTLTYVPGSLSVDGTPRTDAADADGVSAAGNTVNADFGNVTAPATRVIEFKATVN